jgi:hypothetical protein
VIIVILIALPHLISSHWCRRWIEDKGSEALERPIHLQRIKWRWADGLRLEGLSVEDDPAFSDSPLLSVELAALDLDPQALLKRRLSFSLKVEGLSLRMIRDAQGQTNLELLLSQIKREGEPAAEEPTPPKKDEISIPIPVDIQGEVELQRMTLEVVDRVQDRSLLLRDAFLSLHMPSLSSGEAIDLRFSAVPMLDRRELEPVHFQARVENLLRSEDTVDLRGAMIRAEGRLPGCEAFLESDLKTMGITGRMNLDLGPLVDIVRPFMPQPLSATAIEGQLALSVELSGDFHRSLAFEVLFEGENLNLSGGVLADRSLGPIRWRTVHQGAFDFEQDRLIVERGDLSILDKGQLAWRAVVDHFGGETREVKFDLGPASFDLNELYPLAGHLLPETVKLALPSESDSASLRLARLMLIGAFTPDHPSAEDVETLELEDFRLSLPAVRIESAGSSLSGQNVSFFAPHLQADTDQGGGTVVQGQAGLELGKLKFQGVQGLELEGLSIPSLDVSLLLRGHFPVKANLDSALRLDRLELEGDVQTILENLELPSVHAQALFEGRVLTEAGLRAGLHLGDMALRGEKEVSLTGLIIPSLQAQTRFSDGFPEELNLKAAVRLGEMTLKGERDVMVEGLEFPSMDATARDIRRSDTALLGFSALLKLSESLAIRALRIPGLATITDLSHAMDVDCTLPHRDSGHIALHELRALLPSIRLEAVSGVPLETNAVLHGKAGKITLRGLDPLSIDIEGLESSLRLEEFLEAQIRVQARDLAYEGFDGEAQIVLYPAELEGKPFVPEGLRDITWERGVIRVACNLSGRLPQEGLIRPAQGESIDLEAIRKLTFPDRLELSVSLDDLDVHWPLGGEASIRLGQLRTDEPVRIALEKGVSNSKFQGSLSVEGIGGIPSLSGIEQNLGLNFSFSGNVQDMRSLRFEETLRLDALNLQQSTQLDLSGIDRILKHLIDQSASVQQAALVTKLGGRLRGDFRLGTGSALSSVTEELAFDGSMDAGAEIRLVPDDSISVSGWVETPGVDIRVGKNRNINGLQSHLSLAKRYQIRGAVSGEGPEAREDMPSLSGDVLQPPPVDQAVPEVDDRIIRRLFDDLRGQGASRPSLSFESAKLGIAAVPLELAHCAMDFHLEKGLPSVNYFQIDLMGGTLIGSLSIFDVQGTLGLRTKGAFSGVSAEQLLPRAARGVADEQAEISGQFSLAMPLWADLRSVIGRSRLNLTFTRIGARALERMLYALDPYESNEGMVNLRGQLRSGTPRWIQIKVQNGSLSMTGEVEVKGVRLRIPPVERLNLSNLPGLRDREKAFSAAHPLLEFLRILAADSVVIDEHEGKLRFVSSHHP